VDRTTVAMSRTLASAHTDTPSIAFPTLPTDVFDFRVGPTDAPQLGVKLLAMPGGWDAARRDVFRAFGVNGYTHAVMGPVRGGTGPISWSETYTP
jgi:hypothetical protein